MTITTKRKFYGGILSVVSALCLFEALGEAFFIISFRHHYFPAQIDRFEWLRVACFSVASAICFAEGCWLFIYRRFTPAA